MLNRREVLKLAVAAGTLAGADPERAETAEYVTTSAPASMPVIDTNCHLFQWPNRRLPLDSTATLVAALRSHGVTQAWAGNFEALLHRDVDGVNQRLADACQDHELLIPVGVVNLNLPDWQTTLRRCIEWHAMPGIRLYPNYHGYRLNDPRVEPLFRQVADRNCFVQIAVSMEDTRTQHELLRVDDVDVTALPDMMSRVPGIRVQLLNHRLRGVTLRTLADVPDLYFDTARVDGTDGVPALVGGVAPGRVLFGSHAPFLIPEAALIRVYESGQLDRQTVQDVFANNARQFQKGSE